MFRRLLSVGGFTLLSRITGFVRDALLAWTLGSGILSDAFFVAFLFPNYFRAIFGEGTINPAFLPRYAALHAKGEKAAAAKGVKQPAELIATISLGDARTLDGVRAFADAIQPGMSAMLTDEMVRHQLAAIVEAKALDGLDLFAPRYVLVVDGGSDARGLVLVGKVSDPKAFARGAAQDALLHELTAGKRSLAEIDLAAADARVRAELAPLDR